jgi:ribosomal protein L21
MIRCNFGIWQRGFSALKDSLSPAPVFINTGLPPVHDYSKTKGRALESTRSCLSLLTAPLYARLMIHSYNFTVTERDRIITHRLDRVKPGDILEFQKIRELGCKDFTLKGQPFVDPKFFTIRACVVENGKGKRIKMEKKRSRKGIHRNKYSNPLTTVLCIQSIKINPQFEI